MNKLNRILKFAASGIAGLVMSAAAQAMPVDVSFTTAGSAGNWTLDFSVTNNLDPLSKVYFFGVYLPTRDITGTPAYFDSTTWVSWNNTYYGGSHVYNNNWYSPTHTGVASSQTTSGFQVHVTDLVAPTAIDWFAFATGGNWTGGGNLNTSTNPGFEGTAGAPALVSEPTTLAIFGLGIFGLVARRRKQ